MTFSTLLFIFSQLLLQVQKEDDSGPMIIAVFGTIFLFGVLVLYHYLKYKNDFNSKESFAFTRIKESYREPLQKHFKYYQRLHPLDKKLFEKRVQKFITLKKFVPRNMDHVTDEMKALIAASAIQLMNGLPKIYFAHFKRILVYPDDYYSKISQRYHQGEVSMGGMIVLSWKNFLEGYVDSKDGRNLGLHEMAHALRLENAIHNEDYGFLDDDILMTWTDLCYQEINKMDEGKSDFFRNYAATNSHEFFAVAVEHFFEKSQEFHDWHPKLYDTLSSMLNQDPLTIGKLG
jgi:Mlc titration factor MtfA (ptsG expression regulator)